MKNVWERRLAPVRRRQASVVFVFVFAFCLLAPAFAQAAASYVFDPTLSLAGACQEPSPVDEVPDPGCPAGKHPGLFKGPSVTTDAYGDIYVANIVAALSEKSTGRIDVFDPNGIYITTLKDEDGPQSIAVDSKGNLYVFSRIPGGERTLRRYSPTVYEPSKGEIEYGSAPTTIIDEISKKPFELGAVASIAVDPLNDDLWVDQGLFVAHFSSAEKGNELLEQEAIDVKRSTSIAIDGVHERIYVSDEVPITQRSSIRIFELEAPHSELGAINGSTTPKGEFLSTQGFLSLDVDDPSGHVFVGDIAVAKKVYEFEEDGAYLATIEHSFEAVPSGEITVDDGPFSPHPQVEGYLFVPSVPRPGNGHVYAFEPKEVGAPIVEETSVNNVTEAEATLDATINPDGLETTYRLEYVSQQQYEEDGESFASATVAGEGTLFAGGEGKAVSIGISGLEPGTSYIFHVFAENEEGSDEGKSEFSTFPPPETLPPCPNDAFRIGTSSFLPDCRAYELVTPPDTNGRPPTGGVIGAYVFPTLTASPDGNRATFIIEGGLIPGNEGSGGFVGDRYLATRGSEGWTSAITGPSGEVSTKPAPGSVSPDQTYALWMNGTSVFLRYPDGHSELVGRGSLGEDPEVDVGTITEGAGHIVFATKAPGAVQLEPNAPSAGTATLYERSAEGSTQVVSLLPGDKTPGAGQNAKYLGASEEGEGIAFSIAGTIYLRLHEETFEVAGSGAKFAGIADEGQRVFYLEDGDLFAFDAEEEETIPFSESGDVTPVNVASGGTRAYFVSPSVLTGEPNPNGEEAEGGKENLYLSEEGAISFVGIVTERDVEGEFRSDGQVGGLGLWTEAVELGKPAKDPSRTTPSGSTLLFESRADLAGFESEGFAQVYRYDASEGRLSCLSCSPTGTPPSSDASLQSISEDQFKTQIGGQFIKISNQSPDGQRAFFQTAEPLVVQDTDGLLDVYEWEGQGTGSCKREGGCTYLISSGHSPSPDYLFGMSASANDVFFRTADLLLPRDAESTLSIYDARIDGGFAEPHKSRECVSVETCLPQSTPAPALPAPGRPRSEGNVTKHCPKGKRKAKRHGKVVCVKNHKKHHHRAGSKAKGGAR